MTNLLTEQKIVSILCIPLIAAALRAAPHVRQWSYRMTHRWVFGTDPEDET
jgi:hypothetical protein